MEDLVTAVGLGNLFNLRKETRPNNVTVQNQQPPVHVTVTPPTVNITNQVATPSVKVTNQVPRAAVTVQPASPTVQVTNQVETPRVTVQAAQAPNVQVTN
jgi:hypothetical protein